MGFFTLNNGIKMPMVGFGTWDVRGQAGEDAIVQAIELGYRLFDTARMYENEEIVGRAIKRSGVSREELFITTKLNRPCASYKKAKEAIRNSLERLELDQIDLCLVHEPYAQSYEMYRALEEAYQAGLIRAIGISNFDAKRYVGFVKKCTVIPAVNQVESHVYFPEFEVRDAMKPHGTVMQGWASFTEGRRNIFEEPILKEVGEKYEKTAGQAALKYLVQNGVGVIPKSVNPERMKENIDLFDFRLSEVDMTKIAELNEHKSLFGWY